MTAPRPAANGTLYLRVFLDAITACAVDVAFQQVPREGAIRCTGTPCCCCLERRATESAECTSFPRDFQRRCFIVPTEGDHVPCNAAARLSTQSLWCVSSGVCRPLRLSLVAVQHALPSLCVSGAWLA